MAEHSRIRAALDGSEKDGWMVNSNHLAIFAASLTRRKLYQRGPPDLLRRLSGGLNYLRPSQEKTSKDRQVPSSLAGAHGQVQVEERKERRRLD